MCDSVRALAQSMAREPTEMAAVIVLHQLGALRQQAGNLVELQRDGETWRATHTLANSTLYRVVAAGTEAQPPSKLRRLDAIPDRAPQVKVLAPDRGLSLVAVGQTRWALAFEARDDYGVAATATLKLTLAQGSGENVRFTAFSRPLAGEGGNARKRYAATLDLAQLGMAVGDDLIAGQACPGGDLGQIGKGFHDRALGFVDLIEHGQRASLCCSAIYQHALDRVRVKTPNFRAHLSPS